ncbi:hypothetical protein HQN64_23910 [Enterobacteriaceae bacterium BIT-l23]|uniref:hypothetical protein n=1 Tax=Jejubacter sp. L23 TaxID=3092086 RepID=UPI0015844A0B|nr:hypothetical protein [Enterobacteriaceae bacterium BIT-l23]
MVDKSTKDMITHAQRLEVAGYLRRAISAWQSVILHSGATSQEQEFACDCIVRINELLQHRGLSGQQDNSQRKSRRERVSQDKEAVRKYLEEGRRPEEIVFITQRSRAFVYKCMKEL